MAGHPIRDAMCVGRYEMNTERSGVLIEMPVTDATHTCMPSGMQPHQRYSTCSANKKP